MCSFYFLYICGGNNPLPCENAVWNVILSCGVSPVLCVMWHIGVIFTPYNIYDFREVSVFPFWHGICDLRDRDVFSFSLTKRMERMSRVVDILLFLLYILTPSGEEMMMWRVSDEVLAKCWLMCDSCEFVSCFCYSALNSLKQDWKIKQIINT